MRAASSSDRSMPLAYGQDEDHPWVDAYLEHCLGNEAARDLNKNIAAGDEMFAYAIDSCLYHRGHALVSYFRSGLLAFEATRTLLERSAAGSDARVLDFASGHGRSIRFLSRYLDPDSIYVCEIGDGAHEFLEANFGVRTVAPSLRPEGFDSGRTFDLVTAFSFFTHLPYHRFTPWLESLWRSVAPGGALALTTHGSSVLPPGRALNPDGFLFEGHSESERLETADYGSCWISRQHVEQLAGALPELGAIDFLERGVWAFQDLFVLTREGASGVAPAQPSEIEPEPIGFLETARPISPGSVELTGWALDRRSPGEPVELEVLVNRDVTAQGIPTERRPDLPSALAPYISGGATIDSDRLGFAFEIDLGRAVHGDDFLIVEATAANGRKTVLHASSLEGAALLRTAAEAEQRAQNEAETLRSRLYAMEQSRFWQLRNRWFAVKRLWQRS